MYSLLGIQGDQGANLAKPGPFLFCRLPLFSSNVGNQTPFTCALFDPSADNAISSSFGS